MNKKIGKIIDLIIIIVLLFGVFFAYKIYAYNNFNQFSVSEKNLRTSDFTRDNQVKYSENASYKITSESYNDAMFWQTVKVEKNTPYKVTCMVKTNNVQSENNLSGSGAQISIEDTTERSIAITGTTDWQQIEMIFNSKNREEINIGFRLGGYIDDCIGEAWFSDFTLEKGEITDTNTNWNFACFIFYSVDANVSGQNLSYSMTESDIADMRNTIQRFENACAELSENKMSATCDVYSINDSITTLSYDDEYGYYVSPEDVEEYINSTINTNDYDHIFIIFKLGDETVNDWIGLGAMDYYGIGFSNIRLPNESNSYIYKYNARINQFPEEVLMHEFLHSLERTLQEYGYDIPALHDYEQYGYKNQMLTGLKDWYADYMNCRIQTSSGYIGLDEIVYTLKPAKNSNFENSSEVEDAFYEPENFIEEIAQLFRNLVRNISLIVEQL